MLPPNPSVELAFLYGALGSAAVELVLLVRAHERGRVPKRYGSFWFWTVRLLLVLASGLIATAYYTPAVSPILYVHIGAATPVIPLQLNSPPADSIPFQRAEADEPKPVSSARPPATEG